jgi:hypothetical protein
VIGPEGVALALVARLEARLPARLEQVRARHTATARDLPDPVEIRWTAEEGASIERFPMITVTPVETDPDVGALPTSSSGFGNSYQYRYRSELFVWVRGRDYPSTQLAQWRYALAVREVLLAERPLLPAGGPDYLTIDPNRLSETYSDIGEDQRRQWIAGTRIVVETLSQEYLPAIQPTAGTAAPTADAAFTMPDRRDTTGVPPVATTSGSLST